MDRFDPERIEGRVLKTSHTVEPTAWRFDEVDAAAPPVWAPGAGVEHLALRSGRLQGRTSAGLAYLSIERTHGLESLDLLHEIEVRLKVSAGANLAIDFDDQETINRDILMTRHGLAAAATTPLIASDELQTYRLRSRFSVPASQIRHVIIWPTDAAGASFEIESVRLIFREEYLLGVPSGVSWQGLSEIYHETIVTRDPEVVRMQLTLPPKPWLDLSIGTIEEGPVTFRVAVQPAAAPTATEGEPLLVRTVTTPHRWEPTPIDLSAHAGKEVRLSLWLTAPRPGSLGFWGSPVVRSRGAAPRRERADRDRAEPPRGVIVIWADTLRRDHLGAYGYGRETDPFLQGMAAQGTLFENCVSQATWTKVATPSLLTSLYPTSHGVKDFTDRIPAAATTLAEVYRQAGYATLQFSSILFTGKFTNLHQGFEQLHEDGSLPDRRSSKTARAYMDRLFPWLELHRDAPFFALVHVADPHDPFRPYPPYDAMWGDPKQFDEHERQAREVRRFIKDPLLRMFGMPNRAELAAAGLDPDAYVALDRDWYDGSIRAMDAEIGRLFERLRILGLDRSTLVVFAGDHGEEFLEHGRMFHGQSVYGELTQIPLIVWGPRWAAPGARVRQLVQTIDVMPTLLELSGLRGPREMQGRSLRALLAAQPERSGAVAQAADDGPRAAWKELPAISEKALLPEASGGPPPYDSESYAIVSEGFKLIHNPQRDAGQPEFELYDKKSDPLDRVDLAARHPEIVTKLSRRLQQWRAQAEREKLPPDSESAAGLSAQELERLRSLGYIQ
ncbi:MAG TPA: sulfatase [Acidobacteriota bacterium]